MKKSKLLVLSGLAMLTMAFAMSCSNPAGGDTTPAPTPTPKPVENIAIDKFVAGKTFTDGDEKGSVYVYDNQEKTYTLTMRTAKPINFEYAVLEGGKVVSHVKDTLKVEETTDSPAAVASRQLTQALIDNPFIVYDAKIVNGKLEFTNGKKCDDIKGANPTDLKLDSEVIDQNTVATLKAKLEAVTLTLDLAKTVANKLYKDADGTSYKFTEDGKQYEMGLGSKNKYKVTYDATVANGVITATRNSGKREAEDKELQNLIDTDKRPEPNAYYTAVKAADSITQSYKINSDGKLEFTVTDPDPMKGAKAVLTEQILM